MSELIVWVDSSCSILSEDDTRELIYNREGGWQLWDLTNCTRIGSDSESNEFIIVMDGQRVYVGGKIHRGGSKGVQDNGSRSPFG